MQNPLPEQVTFDGLLFPGRRMLNVAEIAERLLISQRHVVDLIDEGRLRALNISGDKRRHYRIPVEAYEAFIRARTL